MTINKKALDATQLGYLEIAEKLQGELIAHGFMASRVEKGEDRTDFKVIFFDGVHEYRISRNYDGNVSVSRIGTPNDNQVQRNYPNVSSSTRGEVWRKYQGQNVKVITAKKLQAKIDAENAYHAEMEALESAAGDKIAAFIEEAKALEAQGVKINWQHDRDNKEKVTGGHIERGGLEFSFEMSQDGYVSKKMRVSYMPETSLKNFMLLSDNKYNA